MLNHIGTYNKHKVPKNIRNGKKKNSNKTYLKISYSSVNIHTFMQMKLSPFA